MSVTGDYFEGFWRGYTARGWGYSWAHHAYAIRALREAVERGQSVAAALWARCCVRLCADLTDEQRAQLREVAR